ncbi:LytTR family transcriptional regulator [bacterium]|nr:LytTR family transcriptional regulator [bacterium]MCI0607187.1 LytTR family transcriptional regulator [bacterium]
MELAERILVRSNKSWLLLNRNEIQWIEAKGPNTLLHCRSSEYSIRIGIRSIESKLDPEQFIRIHRSYIVNVNTIRELKLRMNRSYDVILEDGTKLICTRYYKDRFHFIEKSAVKIAADK